MEDSLVSVCLPNQDAKAVNNINSQIKELFATGQTWNTMARHLGISEKTVRSKAKEMGLAKRKHITIDDVSRAVAGCSTDKEAANVLQISIRTLKTYQKTYGIGSAARHGGRRDGAGKKPTTSPERFAELLAVSSMAEQQVIDARVNSFDARVRTNRGISSMDLLRWAGSAFKYNRTKTSMVVKKGCWSAGMPKSIPMTGGGYMPGGDGNSKSGKANISTVQALRAAQGQ